jgi:hypothetical protein
MLQITYVNLYKDLRKYLAEKETLALLAKERGGLSQSALIRCLIHEAARAAGLSLNEPISSTKKDYDKH